MRIVFVALTTVLALWASGSAVVEWRDYLLVQSLDEPLGDAGIVSEQRELVRVREAAAATRSTGAAYARLGGMLRRSAEAERDPGKRIALFCEALSSLGIAVTREPHRAAYLVNWANLRQLLGSVDCREPLTAGDFKAAARQALAVDPTDTRVLYAAAQIASWSDDPAEMRRLLRSFLALKVELKPSEQEFILSRIQTGEDAAAVIPPRFPQALEWTRLVSNRSPELLKREVQVFAEMQRAAVLESAASFEAGAVPADLHRRRLLQLADVCADDSVQQLVDGSLAAIFRRSGQLEQAEYYAARSQLEELAIVRTVVKSDTRPTTTALLGWGFDDAAVFDEFFSSVGFFVPAGSIPRIVQLVSSGNAARIDGAVVQVLASNDNQNWLQVSDRTTVTAFPLGEAAALQIRLESGGYRYWKIHFGSSDRSRLFKNSLSRLVKVYGVHGLE